jgi:hypothetical protein
MSRRKSNRIVKISGEREKYLQNMKQQQTEELIVIAKKILLDSLERAQGQAVCEDWEDGETFEIVEPSYKEQQLNEGD